jgi:DNA-directed RNA polymerase specialized sigma24 family protein
MDRGAGEAALVRALYDGWRRFAAVVAPIEIEPDDLVQEALARTLQRHALSELDDPDRYVRVVILRLASNERRHLGVTRRWRQRMPRTAESTDAYPSDVSDLQRLSPKVRAALFLAEVERWQFADIAEVLGCSEEAARARAVRGRHELRAALIVEER